MINVKIKKLHENAVIPKAATDGSAGLDLVALEDGKGSIGACGPVMDYRTGLSIAIPKGYVGLIFPRSSIGDKTSFTLANSVGVIDSDYRGEILAKFRDLNELYGRNIYNKGDRMCQLVIVEAPEVIFEEVDDLDETDRGDGGFGSSGE